MESFKLALNIGLVFSLLLAPIMLLMAWWYRKQIPNVIMVWKKPESVIVTVGFSLLALILFIVGISSFFTHYGFLDPGQIQQTGFKNFKAIGILSFLLTVGIVIMYLSIRILFVQIITSKGIVMNTKWFPIPRFRQLISWHQISDYYIKSDYPNVIFTLIVKKETLEFQRNSIKVPAYTRDAFEQLLEVNLENASFDLDSKIKPYRYPKK